MVMYDDKWKDYSNEERGNENDKLNFEFEIEDAIDTRGTFCGNN